MAISNRILNKAAAAKEDEFYTQLVDIEQELRHYREHFKGKTVFCNCDDPFESNFFKYFAMNFNYLGLKKLIATSYAGSPIVGKEVGLFEEQGKEFAITKRKAYKVVMAELKDVTGDGREDLFDVVDIIRHRIRYLKGDGGFESPESLELLKEADIVVTNPPFSLFREYMALLMEYNKKFVIIGNKNALTYKEIFPLIKDNKVWTGYRGFSGGMWFYADYEGKTQRFINGKKIINVPSIWFTNLEISKRHEEMILYKNYTPEEYPKYDDYDAINVDKTKEIPKDYFGLMGVPVTFIDKYNPEQFEIVGLDRYVPDNPRYGRRFTINGKEIYARILIRIKKQGCE